MMRCSYIQLSLLVFGCVVVGGYLGGILFPTDHHVSQQHPISLEARSPGKYGVRIPVHDVQHASIVDGQVAVPQGSVSAPSLSGENFSGASHCGKYAVVIGVLSSATDKGKFLRQTLRETWFRLADTQEGGVTIRFLLSLPPGDVISEEIAAELKQYNDILLLPIAPGTRRGYSGGPGPSNILERVRSFMRWSTQSCAFRYVLKTDDDCYVAVDKLLQRVNANDFETERLYFGRFLFGMAGRDDKGKPDSDNYQNRKEFPGYAGAGYMITPDVVKFLGNPGLPMLFHRVEDRGVGVMLNGFNVTYRKGEEEFQPWGKCFDSSLWIHHFQKDPLLMKRRYERAAAGKSICGEGFTGGVVCGMADQGKNLNLKCKNAGEVIKHIEFASYGLHTTSAPGPCAEGPDALTMDESCHYPKSKEIVENACLGKHECLIKNTVEDLGVDPCPGKGAHWDKRFVATVRCQ
eukprot:m.121927 g.121927  ORF g.121927 m.121927 type:complete len:462 (+) comp28890_c0_seq1:385-1770(+)